jgi:two-component system OmpR family response regulator
MYAIWNAHSCSQKARRFNPGASPEFDVDLASPSEGLLRKVLVVDDERDLADITAALLNANGLDVLVAYSAKDALIMLQDHRDIDAVFSDVVMPGMTGFELAKFIDERRDTRYQS